MTDLRMITSNGGDTVLEDAAVRSFADSLRGPLLRPETMIMTRPAKSGMA